MTPPQDFTDTPRFKILENTLAAQYQSLEEIQCFWPPCRGRSRPRMVANSKAPYHHVTLAYFYCAKHDHTTISSIAVAFADGTLKTAIHQTSNSLLPFDTIQISHTMSPLALPAFCVSSPKLYLTLEHQLIEN